MLTTGLTDTYLLAADLGETEDPRLLTKVQPVTRQVHLQVQPLSLFRHHLLLLALLPATASSKTMLQHSYVNTKRKGPETSFSFNFLKDWLVESFHPIHSLLLSAVSQCMGAAMSVVSCFTF